jgi:hypothetical protein
MLDIAGSELDGVLVDETCQAGSDPCQCSICHMPIDCIGDLFIFVSISLALLGAPPCSSYRNTCVGEDKCTHDALAIVAICLIIVGVQLSDCPLNQERYSKAKHRKDQPRDDDQQ